MTGSSSIAGARNASIFILYLFLAAGIFGGTLLYHIVWVTRCRDAIDMSHTASQFAKTYAGMDVTKAVDFKLSLNSTMTRVLDEELPMLISRTCFSLDVFNASPALRFAYMIFVALYGLSIVVFYTQVSCSTEQHAGTGSSYSLDEEVDRNGSTEDGYVQEMMCGGFVIGCKVATVVWILVLSSFPWSSAAFDGYDCLALLSLEGFLFSMLPAMGGLISVAWPPSFRTTSDEVHVQRFRLLRIPPSPLSQWPGYDAYNTQPVVVPGRPVRGRHRHGSDLPHQTTYFTDANGMLIPQAGAGLGRSNSVSGGRPAQIVINNTQWDEFSPPHSARRKSRGHSPGYSDDDNWDERAHSPRRYRNHSRERSRDRSRRRSRDRSRRRSRSRSHERRRHSHRPGHESASPAPYWDLATVERMRKLEALEKKEEEEAARERAKQERLLAEAKAAAKKKEEEEFKKRVLAEAERERYEKEMKEKKKKEEEDKIFKARLKDMYLAQGYSEESIEIMIKDAESKKKGHGPPPPPPPGPHSPHALSHDNAIMKVTDQMKVVDLNKTTYIKVHRKYLSPDTLDAYGLPWEWDDEDSNYLVIKCWINQKDQDKLFAHTSKLREQRLLTSSSPVELKKDSKGKLMLVRDKSPSRQRSRNKDFSIVLLPIQGERFMCFSFKPSRPVPIPCTK
ncbi:MAG: hypothetical protein Q9216_000693 [Gyalolechia sp. 2 TL-2023]